MKIKAVIFDVGNVLQLSNQQRKFQKQKHYSGVHETIAKKLKISIDQYLDSIDYLYANSMQGKISEKKLINGLTKNLGISEKKLKNLYAKTYNKKFKKNKSLFNQVLKLRKLGYKTAVLSDQWHLSNNTLIPKKDKKHFDKLIISCEVGLKKPDLKIYKLVLKKLKLKPDECIFIDNQKWNLVPAKKLGIKTILFTSNKGLFKNKIWQSLFK